MTSDDILQLIPNEKLLNLRDLFKENWPYTMHVYYFIDTCIKYKNNWPTENYVSLYCPYGDFKDGTFIAIIEIYCYNIFFYTLDPKLKRLELSLKQTNMIDWSKKPLFASMHETFFDMIVNVRNQIGHPVSNEVPTYIWWLPKEKALQFNCTLPPEIYAAPLTNTHIPQINSNWPLRSTNSEKYLEKVLELNGGLGLFLKSNHDLCAWVFKTYFGGLGMLQTADGYKRKGYGSLVVKLFSKILAEQENRDVNGYIIRKNLVSQNFFTKLGFEPIVPVVWCEY